MLSGIELTYRYYFPENRERETENYVKAVSDYLVKQKVIAGDNWQRIRSMTITAMGIDKALPRVEITIT